VSLADTSQTVVCASSKVSYRLNESRNIVLTDSKGRNHIAYVELLPQGIKVSAVIK